MYEEFKPDLSIHPRAAEDFEIAHEKFPSYPKWVETQLVIFITIEDKIAFLKQAADEFQHWLFTKRPILANCYIDPKQENEQSMGVLYWDTMESVYWLNWKMGELKKMQKQEQNTNESNSEPTTPFQVLIIHYLLKHLNLDINPTQKAKLIHALTGKDYKNIYDAARKPLETDTGKERTKDLMAVRLLFESSGLGEIARLITNDLQ